MKHQSRDTRIKDLDTYFVTARLLPRDMSLDAIEGLGIIDEGVEEVIPFPR